MSKKYEELDFTDDFMFGKVLYSNQEGLKEGHNEINQMVTALMADNRLEELRRSAADKMFQEQLLKEYRIGKYGNV